MPIPGMPPIGGAGTPAGAGGAGATPPALSTAGANMGPAVKPQGNNGNVAMAMIDIKNGLQMLQKALPMIPMGSELHSDILKVTQQLTKHMKDEGQNPGLQLQSLLQMAKSNASQAPMSSLAKLYPGAGAPPAMPGAAPGAPTPPAA